MEHKEENQESDEKDKEDQPEVTEVEEDEIIQQEEEQVEEQTPDFNALLDMRSKPSNSVVVNDEFQVINDSNSIARNPQSLVSSMMQESQIIPGNNFEDDEEEYDMFADHNLQNNK